MCAFRSVRVIVAACVVAVAVGACGREDIELSRLANAGQGLDAASEAGGGSGEGGSFGEGGSSHAAATGAAVRVTA